MGAIVLGAFGALWLLGGLINLATLPVALAVILPALLIIVVPARRLIRLPAGTTASDDQVRRRFIRINAIQGVAILVAFMALSAADRQTLIPAAISVIVALHFVPLAPLFRAPLYYATALGMLAVVAAGLAEGGDAGAIHVMLGTGAILWFTALIRLIVGLRALRRLPAAAPA